MTSTETLSVGPQDPERGSAAADSTTEDLESSQTSPLLGVRSGAIIHDYMVERRLGRGKKNKDRRAPGLNRQEGEDERALH